MEIYFLWRLSMVLIIILAFSVFVGVYTLANKIIHRKKEKRMNGGALFSGAPDKVRHLQGR